MREPPAALLRLTRFLGGEPSREASRKQYWFWLIVGVAFAVLFAVLLVLPPGPTGTRPFSEPIMVVVGLMVAAQAAGLLREDRRGISLWLSALGSMLNVPLVILGGALVYAWVGVLGAVAWAVFVVSVGVWHEARRRGRALG